MMRQRILLFSTIAISTITMAVLAAGPGRPTPPVEAAHGMGPQARGERLAAYLSLSEAQVAQWDAIRESTRAQRLALAQKRRTNREALKSELEEPGPDAQTVGALVIARHQLRDQAREIRESSREQFAALLTPEQKEKYDNFLEITKNQRGRRHGMRQGAGRGMGHGKGQRMGRPQRPGAGSGRSGPRFAPDRGEGPSAEF